MMERISDNARGAFATALLCTIWMLLANTIGWPGWAGFAGCTAYFAAPKRGLAGLPLIFVCVCSGIAYAMGAIYLGNNLPGGQIPGLILTFITTFLMCAGPKYALLAYVPGAFMGSFSTFAAGGAPQVIPAILCGVPLGLACDYFGIWLRAIGKNKGR